MKDSATVSAANETKGNLEPHPTIFFFGQAGDFNRLWLADADGKITAEDNHSSIQAIARASDEPRLPLPADFNEIVSQLKVEFDRQYQDYLASGGIPHRLAAAQRWALDSVKDAHKQTKDETERERLERLRKLWSVSPLDRHTEFSLRGIKGKKANTADLLKNLEAIAFEHKLEVPAERQAEQTELPTEPVIICTEALT